MLDNPNISVCLFGTTSSNNLAELIGASGRQSTLKSKRRIQDVFAGMQSLSPLTFRKGGELAAWSDVEGSRELRKAKEGSTKPKA